MEREIRDSTWSGVVPFFLFGAVAGVAAGMLLAPDSGKETRRKLGQWLKEKREKGRTELLAKGDHISEALEAGKRAYNDAEKKLAGV